MAEEGMEKVRAALDELQPGLAAKFNEDELSKLDIAGFHTAQDLKDAREKDFGTLLRTARLANLRPFLSSSGAGDEKIEQLRRELRDLKARVDVHGDAELANFTYTEGKISDSRDTCGFGPAVKRDYGAMEGGECWCLATNARLPSSTVVGGHLFKRKFAHKCHLLGLQNIDDTRNGLPLWKPVQLVILYNSDADEYKIQILDPNLKQVRLVDKGASLLGHNWKPPRASENVQDLTFGDLQDKSLKFAPGNLNRPYKTCLNFQAREARKEALKKGWINDSWDFTDFYTEGKDRVQAWFSGMLFEEAALAELEDPSTLPDLVWSDQSGFFSRSSTMSGLERLTDELYEKDVIHIHWNGVNHCSAYCYKSNHCLPLFFNVLQCQ